MANFDQKVTIEIDVDTDPLDEITKSVTELKTAQKALNSMEKDLNKLDSNFQNFTKTVKENREEWDKGSDIDDPLSTFRGSIRETRQELSGLRDGLEEEVTVNTDLDEEGFVKNVKKNLDEKLRKDEVEVDVAISEDIDPADKAKVVGQTNSFVEAVEASTQDITLEIDQKVKGINNLAASNIERSANSKIENAGLSASIAPEIDLSGVRGEMKAFKEFADTMEVVEEKKDAVSESNKILKKRNEEGEESALDEAKSFQEMVKSADNLAEVKRDVGRANEYLTEKNKEGTKSALMESGALDNLGLSAIETADLAEDLTDQFRESKESSDNNRRSLRRLSNSIDETGDSMRAANKVGDLFEDGLGSLSVNIGAFTVALRNFLTQVPILLGALGSLGSAAIGVAGSFVAAGGAISSVIGAGALAMAQSLDEQYQEIDGTGEALQVMLRGLRDTFMDAVSPLLENEEVIDIFRQVIVGLAKDISLVADTFNVLMNRQDSWKSGVLGISGVVDELGRRLEEPFAELNESLSFMFLNLQDEFMDMTVGMVDALSGLVRFTTIFTNGITENSEVIDQFIEAMKEMSFVAKTVFGGLEPIFIAFSSSMETVASGLNSMNTELVANAITFGLIISAINKFGGAIASVIGVVPNLIFGIKSADGSMLSMIKSTAQFINQHGTLFAGFTSLSQSVEKFGDEMDILSIRTNVTEQAFDSLGKAFGEQARYLITNAETMDELEEGLIDLAANANLSENEISKLNRELQEAAISAEFAEESLDELDKIDVSDTDISVKRNLALEGAKEGSNDAAMSMVLFRDKISEAIKRMKKFVKGGGFIGALKSTTAVISGSLLPAILLVVAAGALLVGLIGNLDSITSGLGSTMSALGALLSWIGGEVLQIFIDVWNAFYDVLVGIFMVIKPIIDLFDLWINTSGDGVSVIEALASSIEFVVDAIGAFLGLIGGSIRILGTFIGMLLEIIVMIVNMTAALAIRGLMQAITGVINGLLDLIGIEGDTSDFFNGTIDLIVSLIDWISKIPEITNLAMRSFVQIMQDSFNKVIDGFNKFVENINKLPFINFDTVSKVNFGVSGDEGARVSKEEIGDQTNEFMSGLTGKRDNTITYNEDNSTNIDQTIDADPEDQAQLSRVVSDAIAEANSFERRRAGGQ